MVREPLDAYPTVPMLRLRTLGGAGLLDEGRALDGTAVQRRRIALLAVLAVAGDRGMSRDKLAALLWPDSDQERARHSLSQWLFTTRRDLKAEDLFLGTSELRLNAARITSDVADFDAAIRERDHARAVSLHAGPLLDGFHLSGAAEFERWLDAERSRIAASYQRALTAIAEQSTAAGDHHAALDAWRRLAADDPYNARVALSFMRALVAAGETAAAITHARIHASLLREELGAEANPEVERYAAELRTAPPPIPAPVTETPVASHAAAPARITAAAAADVQDSGVSLLTGSPQPATAPRRAAAFPDTPIVARARRRRRLLRRAGIAAAVVVLLPAAGLRLIPPDARAAAITIVTRDAPGLQARRIVVAPLEDFTRDSTFSAFGIMASDWITQALSNTGQFEVVDSRTSVFTHRAVGLIPRWFRNDDPAIAIAEETGARLLVSGRYFKERDSLHVQVRITDIAAGTVLRTLPQPTIGSVAGVQQLVDRVARQVVLMATAERDTSAAGLGVKRALPPSLAVYDETRAAWESYLGGDSAAFFAHAARASQLDTTYVLPVAMQAHVRADNREWAHVDTLLQRLQADERRLSRLERAATELMAARLAGNLEHQVHAALAVAEAAPASPETRTNAARIAVNANRPRRALDVLRDVDPARGITLFTPWYWNWSTAAHHLIGMHETERRLAESGLKRFPRHAAAIANAGRARAAAGMTRDLADLMQRLPAGSGTDSRRWKIALDWSRELQAHGHPGALSLLERVRDEAAAATRGGDTGAEWYLATALGELDRWPESLARWQRIATRQPESLDAQGHLAVAAARAGDYSLARAIEARLVAAPPRYAHGRDALWRARIAVALREHDRAIVLVRAALEQGHARFFDPTGGRYDEPELHADPRLRELWRHPAFRSLIAPRG